MFALNMPDALRIVLAVGFGLGGRWIQLYPERVVPKGYFVGPNTLGARLFRAQMVVLGGFMVLGGTWIALSSTLSLVSFGSSIVVWFGQIIGVTAGVAAVIYVRREVNARPPYISDTPYGWWP
jgi:membrane associated rhomboid family serine protease